MAKRVDHGIREFCASHGFSPTIREIEKGVGLQSTSTVAGYLSRMTRDGLLTSIPGTPRSIQTAEPKVLTTDCEDGGSVLRCQFHFPEGTYLMSVVAMVADGDEKIILPVRADCVEIVHTGRATLMRLPAQRFSLMNFATLTVLIFSPEP